MSEPVSEKWIGIEEAAEHLGVRPITVRDWIKKTKEYQPIKSEKNGSSNSRN